MPGIGTMSSPRESTHASASWAGVAPFSAASASTAATSSRLRCEVLVLEARAAAPEVLLVEARRASVMRAGQEAAAERAVGDEADPELAHRRQDLRLGIARPERVLGLQRGDRMDGLRAANRVRRGLGEPEVAHLALLDELGHRADGLLDRRRQVDAVLVVEVDRLDAEPLAATPRRPSGRTRRLPLIPRYSPCAAAHVPELRRDHDLVAAAGDRLADELLVRDRAVHVGRVEEGDSELERALDRRDRLALVGGRRRTRTSPCSRARAPRPRAPAFPSFRVSIG